MTLGEYFSSTLFKRLPNNSSMVSALKPGSSARIICAMIIALYSFSSISVVVPRQGFK
jgi:hypothetical protein